jgi:hypothetical protein
MFCFLASIKGWVGRVPAITPNVRVYLMFAVAIAEVNMGRARARASQIYAVIRPEP